MHLQNVRLGCFHRSDSIFQHTSCANSGLSWNFTGKRITPIREFSAWTLCYSCKSEKGTVNQDWWTPLKSMGDSDNNNKLRARPPIRQNSWMPTQRKNLILFLVFFWPKLIAIDPLLFAPMIIVEILKYKLVMARARRAESVSGSTCVYYLHNWHLHSNIGRIICCGQVFNKSTECHKYQRMERTTTIHWAL